MTSEPGEICELVFMRDARLESHHSMAASDADLVRSRLVRSASIITPLTLASRVTGYLRDKIIALTLGAGARSDAFIVAFRILILLREIAGVGAMFLDFFACSLWFV